MDISKRVPHTTVDCVGDCICTGRIRKYLETKVDIIFWTTDLRMAPTSPLSNACVSPGKVHREKRVVLIVSQGTISGSASWWVSISLIGGRRLGLAIRT
jgi:hypothetical protein